MTGDAPGRPDLAALIARCAAEPIHAPGAVQPHGALLGVEDDGLVTIASANAQEVLGLGPDPLLGRPLADVVGSGMATTMLGADLGDVVVVEGAHGVFESIARNGGPQLLLEIERTPADQGDQLGQVHRALRTFHGAGTPSALVEQAARTIRYLTGFDRVLVYRFDADFNGEVVAEDAVAGAERFLGLRFPASDIPPQARALYSRARVRVIPDSSAAPSPLLALDPRAAAELDLSDVSVRAVSPVHLQYLRNMGVDASMSVAIHLHDRLWGLIACHHLDRPLRPSLRVGEAVDLVGRTASTLLAALVAAEHASARVAHLGQLDDLTDHLTAAAVEPIEALADDVPGLLDLVHADGVAFVRGRTVATGGLVPPDDDIVALIDHVRRVESRVFSTRELGTVDARWAELGTLAAGALVTRVDATGSDWVVWFRPETREVVRWGGRPDGKEAMPAAGGGLQLSPRSSFDEYLQIVTGTCNPWNPEQIHAAGTLGRRITELQAGRARHRAELAAALQRAVMIDAFPAVPGVDGAACYQPASGDPIGGDWYDVFFQADGTPIVALGDVAGHGVEAAATMSQLRHTLRAYVIRDQDLGDAMGGLNDVMRALLPGEMATALVAELDTGARRVRFVNAGHLPPVIVDAAGGRLVEPHNDPLLGIPRRAAYRPVSVDLPPGSTLILYSDGLVERRGRTLDEGLAALVTAASRLAGRSAAEICDGLLAESNELGDGIDDVTVLAVSFG